MQEQGQLDMTKNGETDILYEPVSLYKCIQSTGPGFSLN